MGRREKLYEKAKNSPNNLAFDDLCALAEEFGFRLRKGGGTSHRVYKRPGVWKSLTFQSHSGKAMPYQVRELLDTIDEYDLMGS